MPASDQTSIKSAVTRASMQTAVLTATIVIVGVFVYYSAARMIAENNLTADLKKNIKNHVEQILPSFLLEEQKAALPDLLNQIKNRSELSRIALLQTAVDLPESFKQCLPEIEPKFCLSSDKSEVGVIIPVAAGGQTLSYLFEARSVNASYTFETVASVAITSAILIGLFVGMLYSLFHKITGKYIPRDIRELLSYVQNLLRERGIVEKPPLKFTDFSVLQDGISTIFNNYKRTQNQAIVGHFASGILHDIKTQLQGIVTASDLAEEAKEDPIKYKTRLETLHKILKKNLPDIQEIVSSTLDANKDISLISQITDIGTTLKSSIEMARSGVSFSEITVELNGLDKNVVIKHDRVQVIRLFFNLIKNAFEAQAKLKGQPKKVSINIEDSSDKILVRVEDAGPGIRGNTETIFDPFITTKKHGAGLGLYNVQKIVSAHGWNIAAKSSEKLGGACFEVSMPKDLNL